MLSGSHPIGRNAPTFAETEVTDVVTDAVIIRIQVEALVPVSSLLIVWLVIDVITGVVIRIRVETLVPITHMRCNRTS